MIKQRPDVVCYPAGMIDDPQLAPIAIRLFAIISSYGGSDGLTTYDLMSRSGSSIKHVKATMSSLISGGYIDKIEGKGRTQSRYFVTIPGRSADTAA